MHSVTRIALAASALAVAFAVAIPLYVYLASEALIERRYPLPVTEQPASNAIGSVRGAHLAMAGGCVDCHGRDLQGRRANLGPLRLWASNLRIDASTLSLGEFERALRRGLAPGATSLWGMPSQNYMYMSESDVAGLFGWLRSLGRSGQPTPKPLWTLQARFAMLRDRIVPAAIATRDAPSSLDLGPRYDGGRYLARIACSECHATDLGGSAGAPDLRIVAAYSRPAFFDLLRRGWGANGRRLRSMSRLAKSRFHVLADYEIMALFDYLSARAHAPAALFARARANELRRRETITLEDND